MYTVEVVYGVVAGVSAEPAGLEVGVTSDGGVVSVAVTGQTVVYSEMISVVT